jgi:hypothetical protein
VEADTVASGLSPVAVQGIVDVEENVQATLRIEVWVDCPYCDTGIDLMEPVGGVWHNESGGVVTQVFPDDNWIERHKHFCVEDVVCPECHKSFNVRGLQW